MSARLNLANRFIRDESGLELIEYALMLAMMIVGIAVTTFALQEPIVAIWAGAGNTLIKAQQ